MRFVLSVACKYLVPRWRQLSVSIISLMSILVISLVVWLAIVFLSVTEGIQNKWLTELVSLNAPVRMTPTDAYYQSYYYQIDSLSSESGYATKSIGEKLIADRSDPYDPQFDMQLPFDFPLADLDGSGGLKDPVKMGWEIADSISGTRTQEYEVALGNLRLNLLRELPEGYEESWLSQVSYFTNVDPQNDQFQGMVLPPSAADLNNLLVLLPAKDLPRFFEDVCVEEIATSDQLLPLSSALYPYNGLVKGCGILHQGEVVKVIVPQKESRLASLEKQYREMGYHVTDVDLNFQAGQLDSEVPFIVFDEGVSFQATVDQASVEQALSFHDVKFRLEGEVQGVYFSGLIPMNHYEIAKAKVNNDSAFWAYQSHIPTDSAFGDGVIISKNYLQNGVRIGDRGYLSYFASTPTAQQEQRMPIYVAGFYDPGLVTIGNKFIFVDPKVTAALRGSLSVSDKTLGNGINVWVNDVYQAGDVKSAIQAKLDNLGVAKYWKVESYHDYEFVQPILQQLQSDKTLFTLVSIIILLVACSNIISMLILLVNDKRKEIGIMSAMGASSKRIAAIFGLCGFITGLISSCIGAVIAIFTVHHIELLVRMLNFFQGHEMFQTAFYGSSLPNTVSWSAMTFVLMATLLLSLIAGLIPAIKAARVRPTETLRAE